MACSIDANLASIADSRVSVLFGSIRSSISSSRIRSLWCFTIQVMPMGRIDNASSPSAGSRAFTKRLNEAGSILSFLLAHRRWAQECGYQTVQRFCGAIAAPALQENVLAKPGLSEIGPFTRHCAVECGFVFACNCAASGL